MRREQVVDAKGRLLSPQELQRKFALPNPPTRISDVKFPSDKSVTIHISIATPAKGSTGKPVVQYNFSMSNNSKTGEAAKPMPKAWFVGTKRLSRWRY